MCLGNLVMISMVIDASTTPTYDQYWVGQLITMDTPRGGDVGDGNVVVVMVVSGGDGGDQFDDDGDRGGGWVEDGMGEMVGMMEEIRYEGWGIIERIGGLDTQ